MIFSVGRSGWNPHARQHCEGNEASDSNLCCLWLLWFKMLLILQRCLILWDVEWKQQLETPLQSRKKQHKLWQTDTLCTEHCNPEEMYYKELQLMTGAIVDCNQKTAARAKCSKWRQRSGELFWGCTTLWKARRTSRLLPGFHSLLASIAVFTQGTRVSAALKARQWPAFSWFNVVYTELSSASLSRLSLTFYTVSQCRGFKGDTSLWCLSASTSASYMRTKQFNEWLNCIKTVGQLWQQQHNATSLNPSSAELLLLIS